MPTTDPSLATPILCFVPLALAAVSPARPPQQSMTQDSTRWYLCEKGEEKRRKRSQKREKLRTAISDQRCTIGDHAAAAHRGGRSVPCGLTGQGAARSYALLRLARRYRQRRSARLVRPCVGGSPCGGKAAVKSRLTTVVALLRRNVRRAVRFVLRRNLPKNQTGKHDDF